MKPYLKQPPPKQPVRIVDVGPDFGVEVRPAKGDTVSYGAAFGYGGHVRIEPLPWLGLRAFAMYGAHSVSVPRGGLGIPDTDVDQPDLRVTLLGIRLEPTLALNPQLRLFAGVGAGWAFLVTDAPKISGALDVQSSDRDGVLVELSGTLGVTAEPIRNWLTTTLALSGASVTGETGDVFDSMQGFDQSGRMVYVSGLPKFESSFSAVLGLGLLL